mmetsp:Transcript_32327/g.72967  ORF Transcript_32327/g.72967 Transcript_32327/m.72967 type:complete len:213 (+) Transcript_32327:902-1540(+)
MPRATKAQSHRPLLTVPPVFLLSAHLPLRLPRLLALLVPHLLSERLPQRQHLLALSERHQQRPALSALQSPHLRQPQRHHLEPPQLRARLAHPLLRLVPLLQRPIHSVLQLYLLPTRLARSLPPRLLELLLQPHRHFRCHLPSVQASQPTCLPQNRGLIHHFLGSPHRCQARSTVFLIPQIRLRLEHSPNRSSVVPSQGHQVGSPLVPSRAL